MADGRRQSEEFGGQWTKEKLNILESYLNAYTTALKPTEFKRRSFSLVYIDAFAGSGQISVRDGDAIEFISGSTERAIGIDDKPFDHLIFVDKDPNRYGNLISLRDAHPERRITVVNSEANDFLRNFHEDWKAWRGVLFLDPFATEVEWSTIKTVASFEALDIWILFPVSAIARMLPVSKTPDEISKKLADRLTRIFGDESWRDLYREVPQGDLFGYSGLERAPGVDGLLRIYKNNLEKLFGDRFLSQSRSLKNSRGSRLYEFIFCVGSASDRAIGTAKRIARYIIEHL